ncbi:SdpA family antimicrobial peptide system protein [Kitasatospora sp. NBC_01287]|uniref:SdpA family antimicrobial peptide system protein n=1 Tax=Kitasatospora sp. NBC_01287 TaxID=2903573 RepID=UPI002251F46D|nr:SdpA family antimicrobial peptide system protein [Kitasatospora sp. NBC_01287]MCX4745133.1 SdpA family antimicrobial peptide system protein [Kitasatospora sp. NBC_01287]
MASPTARADESGAARRRLALFAVSCAAIFSFLLLSVFYTLPSNALSSRHSKGARTFFNTVAPQDWAFFTRNPETVQLGVYAFDGTNSHSLIRTPQGSPSNFFGLSRTQRAQGPEIGYVNAEANDWQDCSGLLDSCLRGASGTPAQHVRNTSPVPTVCGDSYLTEEKTVPWEYRNLVSYQKRVVKIAHLDVSCA